MHNKNKHYLFINTKLWNNHIGTRLVEAVLEALHAEGFSKVALVVFERNELAMDSWGVWDLYAIPTDAGKVSHVIQYCRIHCPAFAGFFDIEITVISL